MARAEHYGVEVAQGKRVSVTSVDEFLYTSDAESPKIATVKTGSMTTDGTGAGSAIVAHGLVYAPALVGFYKSPTDAKWRAMGNGSLTGETDRTNVIFRATQAATNTTYPFKFWVFYDPAQLI